MVNLQIETVHVSAKSRKLKGRWTVDTSDDIEMHVVCSEELKEELLRRLTKEKINKQTTEERIRAIKEQFGIDDE